MFLQGGLGNQLFGWAAGLAYSKKLELPLVLNSSQLYQWGFQLNEFDISNYTLVETPQEFRRVAQRLSPITRALKSKTYYEKEFTFNQEFLNQSHWRNLHGYFQSWKYFEHLFPEIKATLTKDDVTRSKTYRELQSQFQTCNYIAVHVRRGDYVGLQSYHGLIGPEYYKKAISLAENQLHTSRLVVFSDDVDAASEIIGDAELYVDSTKLKSSVETLLLMSQAKSIIGANSSFSLWAGYLSDEANFNVYPKPWFKSLNHSMRDLVLDKHLILNGR